MRSFISAGAILSLVACSAAHGSDVGSEGSDIVADNGYLTQKSWALVDAENRRDSSSVELRAALKGSPESVERALLAYGRIGGPEAIPVLTPFLSDASASIRERAAFAISVAGGDDTHPEVAALAMKALTDRLAKEKDPSSRGALFTALGAVGDDSVGEVFVRALSAKGEACGAAQTGAAVGLGTLLARSQASKVSFGDETFATLFKMAAASGYEGESAARALGYLPDGKESAVHSLATLLNAKAAANEAQTAGWLARAIGVIVSPSSETALASILSSTSLPSSVQAYAAEQLPKQNLSPTTVAAIESALTNENAAVAQAAFASLSGMTGINELVPTLTDLIAGSPSSDPDIAASALSLLASIDADTARPLVVKSLVKGTPDVLRYAAIDSLRYTDPKTLVDYCNSDDVNDSTIAVGSFTNYGPDDLTANYGASAATAVVVPMFKKALAKHDENLFADVGYNLGSYNVTSLLGDVLAELPHYSRPEFFSAREAAAQAISDANSTKDLPVLQAMLHDPVRQAGLAAAAAINTITGNDVSAQVSAHDSPSFATPSLAEINAAIGSRILLKTTRGDVTLRLNGDAPLAATQFVRLAKAGKLDRPFHRVVSNWVAQSGDPGVSGYGHADFTLPNEAFPNGHREGSLGIATSGYGTGDGQYFIDLADNARIDSLYTSFGTVESGMSVAESIHRGDLVTAASLVK